MVTDADSRDADTLRSAAAVLRRRASRNTFLLQVVTGLLEKRADRITRGTQPAAPVR